MEANLDVQGLWDAVALADAAAVDAKKSKTARVYLLGALAEDILLQVSSKKTAAELWISLKTRFVGVDRVRAVRLGTLRGEFERLCIADEETPDAFAGKIGSMVAHYAGLGTTREKASSSAGFRPISSAGWCATDKALQLTNSSSVPPPTLRLNRLSSSEFQEERCW